MFIFKAALLLVSLTCISCNVNEEPLKLTIYFESLCPGFQQFLNTQFYPNLHTFVDYFNLDLVPMGRDTHETVDGKIEWTCLFGPTECYINKVNTCFFNSNTTQTKWVEFLHCFLADDPETREDAEKTAVKCSEKQNVAWDTIKSCLENEADELELAYQNRVNNLDPPIVYVPHVLVNDVYDATLEISLLEDFFTIMCQQLKQKPKACT